MDIHADTGNRAYELLFLSLHAAGRGYVFPCNAEGVVDPHALTESVRQSYRLVCRRVGREFGAPAVRVIESGSEMTGESAVGASLR